MNSKKFSEAMGELDSKYVDEAINYKKKAKKPSWVKWGAIAACICIVAVATFVFPQISNNNIDTPVQVYTLSQPAQMEVRLVEWQSEGFKAVVVDVGDNTIYPKGAELTVIFENETEIVLSDGTFFDYSSDEPQAEAIGWATGETVFVKFLTYEEYLEGNGFYNHVFASHVKIK
jgi:hypothetical protein